ncbi:MAG TPA: hypothetical protein VLE97_00135, partial [Gaiellaceae bacterium]|nr:hypothetical protein [Gaiellaceae bacterium]
MIADWHGTYALPASATPVAIVVRANGVVSLGPGHAGAQKAVVTVHGTRIHFSLPGSPQNVVFDGAVNGSKVAGTVRQGSLRGRFSLRRGRDKIVELLGGYRSATGAEAAVVHPLGVPPILVEFPSGAT